MCCSLYLRKGQSTSSVYTIDVNHSPSNYTNAGYIPTESGNKPSQQLNDGLPTYEEAISGVKSSSSTPAATSNDNETCIPIENTNGMTSIDEPSSSRPGRRHHRRHRRHHADSNDAQNPDAQNTERPSGRRHRRALRHLAKLKRRNRSETDHA